MSVHVSDLAFLIAKSLEANPLYETSRPALVRMNEDEAYPGRDGSWEVLAASGERFFRVSVDLCDPADYNDASHD